MIGSIDALIRRVPPPSASDVRPSMPSPDPADMVPTVPSPDPAETRPRLASPREPSVRDTPAQRQSSYDVMAANRPRRPAEMVHLSPGAVIPGTRYRLLRWLGDGGMGVVYEAEHIDIERRVAVKILRLEVCDHRRDPRLRRAA